MDLFKEGDEFYQLQLEWNALMPDALFFDQYELARETGIDSSNWSKFLRDGAVQKHISQETKIFSEAQQRKLLAKATSNDKSVGTAQMIGAIQKINQEDDAETGFFIYSHVPLNLNEVEADGVTEDMVWQPPEDIHEEDEKPIELTKPQAPKETDAPKVEDFNW